MLDINAVQTLSAAATTSWYVLSRLEDLFCKAVSRVKMSREQTGKAMLSRCGAQQLPFLNNAAILPYIPSSPYLRESLRCTRCPF